MDGLLYKVGDDVKMRFNNGVATLYSNGGTLWPDWLERHSINRWRIKYISVAEGAVKLPENSSGWDIRQDKYRLFGGLERVKRIKWKSFHTSDVTNMKYMFYKCENLTGLDLSAMDTSKVKDMHSMFSRCHKLTALDLSGFDTSNVTDMSFMFNNCKKLKKLDIKNFDTLNVTDLCGMFTDCDRLTDIDLGNFDMSKITDTRNMFDGCRELKRIRMNPVMREDTKTEDMFRHCPAEIIWTDEETY